MRAEFLSFQADDKLDYIVKTFASEKITSAPVFDGNDYAGMVSEISIVEYFMPKKFLFLWKKNKPTPMDEIKKVTALALAKKSSVILNPEQELSDVLVKIVKRSYCLAVMEKGKLVGIVRDEDLLNFFLKELAKDHYEQELVELKEESVTMGTEIDKIMEIVRSRKEVSCNDVAKELGISIKTVEKLCESLEKHHLIKINYSFLKGPVIRGFENGKK